MSFSAITCAAHPLPKNMATRTSDSTNFNGEGVTYTCKDGFSFNPYDANDTRRTVRCQVHGFLEPLNRNCTRKEFHLLTQCYWLDCPCSNISDFLHQETLDLFFSKPSTIRYLLRAVIWAKVKQTAGGHCVKIKISLVLVPKSWIATNTQTHNCSPHPHI